MTELELLPIQQHIGDNQSFVENPVCHDALYATIDYYKKIGFVPPWIGYFVKREKTLVGVAGFKGKPVNGAIEIAYGTFDAFQNQGIGTKIASALVELSLKTDPTTRITARTIANDNYSSRILLKNSFELLGTVNDPEDGEVWEWEYVSP